MSKLDLTLDQVRRLVGGGEIQGDPGFLCRSLSTLERAGPDQLSYVKGRRHFPAARASAAGALLVPEPIEGAAENQLVVERPQIAFGLLLARIARKKRHQPSGIHPRATVDPGAEIGAEVTIGPGAVVREGARIGDRAVIYANVYVGQRSAVGEESVLHPNVVIMEDVTLGARVVIHAGSVVGADGYGFIEHEGRYVKIPQVGEVVIGDDVEIGALVTIDRATVDRTSIGRGTKIGDFVHVGHNCEIGEDVLLVPETAVSGSVKIGNRAVLAGRSGVSDNLRIGEGAVLAAATVAFKDVEPGAVMLGLPAREKGLQMRIDALLPRLPQMRRDLRALEKRVAALSGDKPR